METTHEDDSRERESMTAMSKKNKTLMRGSSSFDLMSALKDYTTSEDGSEIYRQPTEPEIEVMKRKNAVHEMVSHLPAADLPRVDAYIPSFLENAIFVGHLVTDMDSIAGSIGLIIYELLFEYALTQYNNFLRPTGAAELYGGVSARASDVNSETEFCLSYWGMAAPAPIEDVLQRFPDAGVCLVDHQQVLQIYYYLPFL